MIYFGINSGPNCKNDNFLLYLRYEVYKKIDYTTLKKMKKKSDSN